MSMTSKQIKENGSIVRCPVCGELIPFSPNDFNHAAELLCHSIFLNGNQYRIVCPRRVEVVMGWVLKSKRHVL